MDVGIGVSDIVLAFVHGAVWAAKEFPVVFLGFGAVVLWNMWGNVNRPTRHKK